jgi:hypothetical protein
MSSLRGSLRSAEANLYPSSLSRGIRREESWTLLGNAAGP